MWLYFGSKQLEIGNLKTCNKNFFKKSTKRLLEISRLYTKMLPLQIIEHDPSNGRAL